MPSSWVAISRSAVLHQVTTFKKLLGSTKLVAVVKSNAYGHGMKEIASVLTTQRSVAAFAVVSLDEALELVRVTRKPILILSIWQKDRALIRRAVGHGVTFPIFDFASARWLNATARRLNLRIPVHLKIDVGTQRLGFRFDE